MWDVDRLAGELPASLLAEWREFYRSEPFGFAWEYRMAGEAAAAAYNANPFRSKDAAVLSPADFIPDLDAADRPRAPALTPAERRAKWMAVAKLTGGYREPKKE